MTTITDYDVSYHCGGLVLVLQGALDTTEIKHVLEHHWQELCQLSLGDEGFDKVGRSPPFYRFRARIRVTDHICMLTLIDMTGSTNSLVSREFIDPEGVEKYTHLSAKVVKAVSCILRSTRPPHLCSTEVV